MNHNEKHPTTVCRLVGSDGRTADRKLLTILVTILCICCNATFASCSSDDDKAVPQPTVTRIQERGTLLVGTTGDYRPLSFKEADGTYWGFGIEMPPSPMAKSAC